MSSGDWDLSWRFVSCWSDVWNPALPLASLPLCAFMMCKSRSLSLSQNSFSLVVFQSGVFFQCSLRGSIYHLKKGGRWRERRKKKKENKEDFGSSLSPVFWQKEQHYSWRQEYGRLFAQKETRPCLRWKCEFWLAEDTIGNNRGGRMGEEELYTSVQFFFNDNIVHCTRLWERFICQVVFKVYLDSFEHKTLAHVSFQSSTCKNYNSSLIEALRTS